MNDRRTMRAAGKGLLVLVTGAWILFGLLSARDATARLLHAQEPYAPVSVTPVHLPLILNGAGCSSGRPCVNPTSTPTPTNTPGGEHPTPTAIPTMPAASGRPVIHVLPLPDRDTLDHAGIFWFGTLSPASNFVDVRVGYTAQELVVYLAIFDRRLWYDESPTQATLTDWDAATLFLSTPGLAGTEGVRWRIDAQMNFDGPPANSRRIRRWSGNAWIDAPLTLETTSGWRGEQLNRDVDGRGWAQAFRIPFASLAMPDSPVGAILRMGLVVYDRDSAAGPPNAAESWPNGLDGSNLQSWAFLRIGAPGWQPPSAPPSGETLIRRQHQADTAVPDADIGGTTSNLCGGGTSFWEQWPNANYGHSADFNVQNQIDIADWPCFSKYYITFPLDSLPSGKVILSATLRLHQWGNSGAVNLAKESYIQAVRVDRGWQETTLTWNNAPQVVESLSAISVPVLQQMPPWPGVLREWDVSKAVAGAYVEDQPVHLALYSADSDYHSGKFFVTSDTGDWNLEGRPALHVVWGNP